MLRIYFCPSYYQSECPGSIETFLHNPPILNDPSPLYNTNTHLKMKLSIGYLFAVICRGHAEDIHTVTAGWCTHRPEPVEEWAAWYQTNQRKVGCFKLIGTFPFKKSNITLPIWQLSYIFYRNFDQTKIKEGISVPMKSTSFCYILHVKQVSNVVRILVQRM